MLEMGFPGHIVQLVSHLYRKQEAVVRLANYETDWFKIRRGVRQGCIISPCLFNIYSEQVMRVALDGYEKGIRLGGRLINNLRYADDVVLIATSETELQELIDRVNEASERAGLSINISKTKVMVSASEKKTITIQINGKRLEQVESFVYLGSTFQESGECKVDIRKRLAMGKSVMQSLSNIWKSREISMQTKVRLLKALVWSVTTYRCEGWTLRKEDQRRIEAFEMWCFRRLLRVSWTQHKTNEWVLQELNENIQLLQSIKRRKMGYYGHVMRKDSCLEKDIIQGYINGRRLVGAAVVTSFLHKCQACDPLQYFQVQYKGQTVQNI